MSNTRGGPGKGTQKCEARDREGRGQPWHRCTQKATKELIHGISRKRYCDEHTARFIDVFPKNTFKVRKLKNAE